MNVIFVSYTDFSSPSGMHIFHLANALAKCGVRCATYNGGEAETVFRYGKPLFRAVDTRTSPRHFLADCNFDPKDTVIHCWTPRESSRLPTAALTALCAMPVVIHMEDNEEAITEAYRNTQPPEKRDSEALWEFGGPLFGTSHPVRSKEFLASAAGYTCIIESLLDFKPEQRRISSRVFEINTLSRGMDHMQDSLKNFLAITGAISAERNFKLLLERVLREALQAASADGGTVRLLDEKGNRF